MIKANKLILKQERKDIILQFVKYSVVGGIASIGDISVFFLLTGMLGVNHILSNTVSFSLGLLINYLLSREWVFGQKQHRFGRDFALFAVIGVIGLFISDLILYILIDVGILFKLFAFAGNGFIRFAAKLTAVIIVLFWNFAARRKLVFHSAQGGN